MIAGLLKAWRWTRTHAGACFGVVAALLAAGVAFGAWRRRTSSLKATIRAERARTAVAGHAALRDDAQARERELAKDDVALETEIKRAERSVASAAKEAEELSHDEVVRRLNELYLRKKRRRR